MKNLITLISAVFAATLTSADNLASMTGDEIISAYAQTQDVDSEMAFISMKTLQ